MANFVSFSRIYAIFENCSLQTKNTKVQFLKMDIIEHKVPNIITKAKAKTCVKTRNENENEAKGVPLIIRPSFSGVGGNEKHGQKRLGGRKPDNFPPQLLAYNNCSNQQQQQQQQQLKGPIPLSLVPRDDDPSRKVPFGRRPLKGTSLKKHWQRRRQRALQPEKQL